jgi:hypothetical protein
VRLDVPSRFWHELAAEHARDLERFGLGDFKRRQALRYFTWRWPPERLLGSEQLRFLLAHTSPLTWARAAATPADLSEAAWVRGARAVGIR